MFVEVVCIQSCVEVICFNLFAPIHKLRMAMKWHLAHSLMVITAHFFVVNIVQEV